MTERLLELRDLRVDFTVGARRTRAVRGVDLSLDAGEVLALVGESGSGKSVTAASIIGILPERRAVATGSIVFRGQELLGLSERKLNTVRGTHLTMVFQNPLTSLDPSFTIGSQFDEVIGAHDTAPRAEARALAVRWLDNVGIRDPERVLGSYPHELSGGMRQRVVIALSALSEPSLIIADEPTTALDATIQKQVLDLLLGLRGDLGTAILIITHDFGVVAHMSDRVAVMRRGVIVEEGPTAEVLVAPRHDYTKALIASVPRLGARGDELGRRRFQVVEGGVEHTPLPREAWPARERSDASPLVVEHVTKTFGAGRGWRDRHATFTALDDVSIEARAGETLGIIGESGSGKTTLAKIIAGVQPPTSGTATVFGRDYASLRTEAERRDFRRDVQVVFQDITSSLNPRRPVIQQLVEPALRLGAASTRAEAERWAGDLVDAVGLPRTFLRRYPHELSGGQRQRVGIARALSVRPRLLILDEPTSALDVTTQAVTLNLLADLRDELDLTYVMIGHNLSVIEFFCDRVAVMSTGRIVEVVDSHDLGGRAEHEVTRALLDAVLL